jgi:hypothetical protein
MKIGLKEVKDIYLGTKKVSKIYIGTKVAYKKAPTICAHPDAW